jgi:cyanophycinase
MVVGGGAQGPELYAKFIEAAGGPDALIVDVPTAGGDSVYPPDWRGTRGLKAAGARNVVVLHTIDRRVADTDAFVEPISRAGGVWFEGGRQWHLVDSYAGTKAERAFHDVLARGGVVGGSSAGASILSSYLLRGARAGNATIMAPGYEVGFDFLHGVAIDQHVVTRDRLRDLADSLMPRRPDLLGISEDEGTAWIIRGDTAEIVGRSKAFVYGGRDPNDSGVPFLTLRPGDRYDLGARRVLHRAIDDSPLTVAFIDSLFGGTGLPGEPTATVLVARDGKVLVNRSYGIRVHPRYTPTTTVPNFPLGAMSVVIDALASQLDERASGSASARLVARRVFAPVGITRTIVNADGSIDSNVDELYRWELGLEHPRTFARDSAGVTNDSLRIDVARGWRADTLDGHTRLASYATADGRRGAFVRFPDHRAVIIILASSDELDARGISERIARRLLGTP